MPRLLIADVAGGAEGIRGDPHPPADGPDIWSAVTGAISQLCDSVPSTMAGLSRTVARVAPPAFGSRDAALLVRGTRAWRTVENSRKPTTPVVPPDSLDIDAGAASGLDCFDDYVLVSVCAERVALKLVGAGEVSDSFRAAAHLFANSLALVIQTIELRDAAYQRQVEVLALQQIATEILSVRESDELLQSITRTAHRLLSVDIAGVFLLEGDWLVMRSAVGHSSSAFAQVRMQSGQGLAGRVLQNRSPVQVDDYLRSHDISADFATLVQSESIHSALGAPLIVRGEVIGVLEVWRRRRSVFSPRQVQRLVAMANLVAIAIENARLNDAQILTMHKLEEANTALEHQVERLRDSALIQRDLTQLILDGDGPAAIARTVGTLTSCRVAILSTNHEPLATYPRGLDVSAVVSALRKASPDRVASTPAISELPGGGGWVCLQAIQAAGHAFGYVSVISGERPTDALTMTVGQAAVISALHFLEKRAADEARADARDEIIWDLLYGSHEYVRAAASRAERMHIDLRKAHRLFIGRLEGLEVMSTPNGMESARVDRMRQEVRRIVQRIWATHGGPSLVSLRGNVIVTVAPCDDAPSARAIVDAATSEIGPLQTGLATVWGVSRPHSSPLEYRSAYREATIALRAASRLGGANRTAVFEELGVVRLLVAPGDDPDLAEYVTDVIGPIIQYDVAHRTSLVKSLRVYFDTDCVLNVAARQLFVHHKTLRYRLDRIEDLTHLNIRRHEDRFRLDLALRIHDVPALKAPLDNDWA